MMNTSSDYSRRLFHGLLLLLLAGCAGSLQEQSAYAATAPAATVPELEAQIRDILNNLDTNADFTLMVKADNGHTFVHSVGDSSPETRYRSASTSKLVTAVVILNLVKEGVLALDDRPQQYIDNWPQRGSLSEIQLRHLLSFTSGLADEPLCINNPLHDFARCVDKIRRANRRIASPGTEFFYSLSHMQVAGLMAVRATGLASWEKVFEHFQASTGLFSRASYDLPSAGNPRLGGGMHWTATEYLAFLEALYRQSVLTPPLIQALTTDQLQGATIVETPVEAIGEDWHYGFGNWIECHAASFDCVETTKISSPGAYGAYPFIDFEHNYFGILAREGRLGTFAQGYKMFVAVEPYLQRWAALNL